ncbi:stomatin-like protein 3 isoform X2 [Chrysemys picta bellii]|uniref:stomatin-like protein 3 isoform X2 n=1 Tax=Chrysemys picta bellii TaxID=8478 RepID=UPI0032B247E7
MDSGKGSLGKESKETLVADKKEGIGACGWILVSLSFLFVLITFPFSIWMCLKIVKEYERAVVFRLGRIVSKKAKGPGLIMVLPCTDVFARVDLRTVTSNIPLQEILTKDSVTTQVDGVVYYKIHSAVCSVANVTDVHLATNLLAQTTLRNVLGTQSLSQILSGREEIAHNIQIIAAEGERNASEALKQASMVLVEAPSALQLRYLQTLTTLATEKNSTIVFPLPMNMLQGFYKQ